MASRSSSTVWALLTPTDEPMFDGLTKHGRPSSAASSLGRPGRHLVLGEGPVAAWAMPLAASTCLAIALSIASAEPSTPAPTYGDVGQLEEALHGAVLTHRAVQQREDDGALAGLVELAQHGLGRHRAADRFEA